MQKKPENIQEARINQQKELYINDITRLSEDISGVQNKIAKYRVYMDEKFTEINKLKADVDFLGQAELKSKEEVKLMIRKVVSSLNGLDSVLKNVQKQMNSKSKETLGETFRLFKNVLNDLDKMENLTQVFDRVDILEQEIRKSNRTLVTLFTKSLQNFDAQILKIMDLLRPAINKVQLNNSLKKFNDFWVIYGELNKCLDQIEDWRRNISKMGAEKIYKVVCLQDLEAFGARNDVDALIEMRTLWEEKTKESEGLLEDYSKKQGEVKATLDFTEGERKKTQVRQQEKGTIIDQTIIDILKNYNTAYGLFNTISSVINNYENQLTQNVEQKITELMDQLRMKFQSLDKILSKTELIKDPAKKQAFRGELAKKIPPYVAQLQEFFDGIAPQLNQIYAEFITHVITELTQIMKTAEIELDQIRLKIENLDLAASKSIVMELLDLSQDQLTQHNELIESSEDSMMHREFASNATKKTQELVRKIDDTYGISQAKLVLVKKMEYDANQQLKVQWQVKNMGKIEFQDLKFAEYIPSGKKDLIGNPAPSSVRASDEGLLTEWQIPKINRKEEIPIQYQIKQITPTVLSPEKTTHNISSANTTFTKGGKSVLLRITESNGKGILELVNPCEKMPIWNISMQFGATPAIPDLPKIAIPFMKPNEHVTFTYRYRKPQALMPKTFHAETLTSLEVALTKVKDKLNTYRGDIVFDNISELLIYLTKFELYSLKNLKTPLLSVDQLNEDPLEAKFTFARGMEFKTPENPPQVAVVINHTVPLLVEYNFQSKNAAREAAAEVKTSELSVEIQQIDQDITALTIELEGLIHRTDEIQLQIQHKKAQKEQFLKANILPAVGKKSTESKKKTTKSVK